VFAKARSSWRVIGGRTTLHFIASSRPTLHDDHGDRNPNYVWHLRQGIDFEVISLKECRLLVLNSPRERLGSMALMQPATRCNGRAHYGLISAMPCASSSPNSKRCREWVWSRWCACSRHSYRPTLFATTSSVSTRATPLVHETMEKNDFDDML